MRPKELRRCDRPQQGDGDERPALRDDGHGHCDGWDCIPGGQGVDLEAWAELR